MVQQEPPLKHSTTIDAQSYCKSVAEYHSTQEMVLIEYHSMKTMLQLLAATRQEQPPGSEVGLVCSGRDSVGSTTTTSRYLIRAPGRSRQA